MSQLLKKQSKTKVIIFLFFFIKTIPQLENETS